MATVRYSVIEGEIIAEKRGGVRNFYVPDSLGSTVALLDNTQAQTDTFSYWPYGESRTRTGVTPTPFQFVGTAGYYRDSTSKNYVRARYLSTLQAYWMSEDPLGEAGGDTNFHRYAANSPLVYTDPSGTTVVVIGAVPPGIGLSGQAGLTDCNVPKGKMGSLIDGSVCYAKCVAAHEAQHRSDWRNCCSRAGRCWSHATTPQGRQDCQDAFVDWRENDDTNRHCQAYRDERLCIERMIGEHDCWHHQNDNSCCCADLVQRWLDINKYIKDNHYCSNGGWPRIPASPCPFKSDGSLRKPRHRPH